MKIMRFCAEDLHMDEMLLHHFIRKEHVEITLKTLSFQIEIKILCSIDLSVKFEPGSRRIIMILIKMTPIHQLEVDCYGPL